MRRDLENPDWVVYVEQAALAVLDGRQADARTALGPISEAPWTGLRLGPRPEYVRVGQPTEGKRAFTPTTAAATYVRDRFHCRYCWRRLVPVSVLALLHDLFPDLLPYTFRYKAGETHPIYWVIGAEADHVEPGARGGHWTDPVNFATACVVCNATKSDYFLEELGWDLLPIPETNWDGLTHSYRDLWEVGNRPNPTLHMRWIRAFDAAKAG